MLKTLLRNCRRCLRAVDPIPALAAVAAVISLAIGSHSAMAAPITLNLNIDLSRFTDVVGNQVAPISSIHGEFTVTFDPLVTHAATQTGLTVHTLSFLPTSALVFRYNADLTLLTIGGEDHGPGQMQVGNTDLVLMVLMADPLAPTLADCTLAGLSCGTKTGDPDYFSAGYTLDGSPGHGWMAGLGSVSATLVQVPEPASLALVILALAGLAATARRRGKAVRAA